MKKMLVLIVSLMLFSCSSDSVTESKEGMDYSNVNTTLNEEIQKARADFEEYYRMFMLGKDPMTKEEFVDKLYQYAYDYLKALDIVPPLDKEEAVGMAFANYYEMNSVSSPGKMGIARSIEIINNTIHDLQIPALVAVVTDTNTMFDNLQIAAPVRISSNHSFVLQQINNRFDFPFCSPTHTVKWNNYHYPLPPVLNVACGDVLNLSNVAAMNNFMYMTMFKTDFFYENTQNPTGLSGAYGSVARNDSHHIINIGEITRVPVGIVSNNGEQMLVSEVALILGGTDVHVIEISIE
ncbi:hypothetical protein HX004_09675 [Myroides sp. 1354]|uniref:hypothetical protein n=1 Tax=unclassified Myroides TaxID=2642485 RepID=UPI002576298C|nr:MULTISPECIES: hypothetical protein [unclassified Myroides]MDM1045161.1 hypothetical protein [Myroides sp. R163-1]MDM1056043.1 hypothetical protein [Myroides sp. 1354]MDM1069008.1 hypothetical protein [Myroides sp. 1372]